MPLWTGINSIDDLTHQVTGHESLFAETDWETALDISRVLRDFAEWLPAGKRLKALDVGAGRGNFTRALVDAGFDAVGIEPSIQLVERGRITYGLSESEFRATDLFTFAQEQEHGSMELIVAWHVLEHVRDPSFFLKCLAGLLAPEGRIFIQVPGLSQEALHPLHFTIFSFQLLDFIARRAGLRILHHAWDKTNVFLTAVLAHDESPVQPSSGSPVRFVSALLECYEVLSARVKELETEHQLRKGVDKPQTAGNECL